MQQLATKQLQTLEKLQKTATTHDKATEKQAITIQHAA